MRYPVFYMMYRNSDKSICPHDVLFAGTNSLKERWKWCTAKVDDMMGRATGAAFIEGRFGPGDKTAVSSDVKL